MDNFYHFINVEEEFSHIMTREGIEMESDNGTDFYYKPREVNGVRVFSTICDYVIDVPNLAETKKEG